MRGCSLSQRRIMDTDLWQRLQHVLKNDYTFERELAGAGMARLFVAVDNALGRRVAIKVLPPERSVGIDLDRFQREIRIAAGLSHPHIVPVLSAGKADEILYYTMPFIPGESVQNRLRAGSPMDVDEALHIIREVAEALDYAHRAGILHRDVKPGNILLHDGHALVTDFGISRAISQSSPTQTLTQIGAAIGTPTYMSPEQASAERELDARSDVYSLGCVLYEMLSGKPPFVGPTVQAVFVKHVTAPVPSVRNARADVPEWVDDVIRGALAKAPDDRISSAADFSRALAPTGRSVVKPTPAGERKSVAVLPFDNLSADSESEYFSDGMTEDVIARLSRIRDLRVISRTSVMCYKGAKRPLREIARELNVATIVEGSIRRAGHRLRLSAQLIDAATEQHVWTETFDRELTDIFAIQTEIAEQIAQALQARLTPIERHRLGRKPTESFEAYSQYLLGSYHFHRVSGPDFRIGAEHLTHAVRLDPAFAQAYALLSQTYCYLGQGYWGSRPSEFLPHARAAAERAIALDTGLGDAHAALGMVRLWLDCDWPSAERELLEAISLDPNSALSHLQHAVGLISSRQYEAAISAIERACMLDPASINLCHNAAFVMRAAGRFDRARQEIERAMRLDASHPAGFWVLSLLEMTLGHVEQGVAAAEAAASASAGDSLFQALVATAYAAAGRTRDARRIIHELEARERGGEYVWPVGIAMTYAQLGDVERGLDRLAQAVDERAGWMWLTFETTLDPLRSSARYAELLQRVKLA